MAGNIRNGVNIFGVVGNFVGWVDREYTISSGGGFHDYCKDWYTVMLHGKDLSGRNDDPIKVTITQSMKDNFKWIKLAATVYVTNIYGSGEIISTGRNQYIQCPSYNWEIAYSCDGQVDISAVTVGHYVECILMWCGNAREMNALVRVPSWRYYFSK